MSGRQLLIQFQAARALAVAVVAANLFATGLSPASAARASEGGGMSQAGRSPSGCRVAAELAEREAGLPTGLLLAIGKVESGRFDPRTGDVTPWSWTVNMAGQDYIFDNAVDSVAWVASQQASGRRSMDVGCFQINLFYHPNAFQSLDEAFDPTANARYAARFLTELHGRFGSWPLAVAAYHSVDPALGAPYGNKVFATWGSPAALSEPISRFRAPNVGSSTWPTAPVLDRVVVRMSAQALTIRIFIPTGDARMPVASHIDHPRTLGTLPRVVTPH